jgi:fascin 1/2
MAGEALAWSFGLRNHQGLYLTAETFGFRINCNSKVMKKKQIFFLEQDAASGAVFIKTHLNKYLTADAAGNFNGNAEASGADERFTIEAQHNGTWAIKSAHGYYTGGTGEKLTAYTKEISEDRLWVVQLAMHPHVNIRNINRKRFVHLKGDQLTCDEDIPWGEDALISLQMTEDGRYTLQACDGRFLSSSGALAQSSSSDDTRFTLEFHGGNVAFRSAQDNYLTCLGGDGKLKCSKKDVGKDELFVLQDSEPQLKLTAWNGKKVSVRSGIEVSANQSTSEDGESFQIEINKVTRKWSFRTFKDVFWKCNDDATVHGSAEKRDDNSWFTIVWNGPKLAIKASNGKYLATKKSGQVCATSDTIDEFSEYVFEVINRPKLVLRGEHGFVGTLPSGLLECNKSGPEVFHMHVTGGVCEIRGGNGKYWKVGDNSVITVTGDSPTPMFLEFVENTKFLTRAGAPTAPPPQGGPNGAFPAPGPPPPKAPLGGF